MEVRHVEKDGTAGCANEFAIAAATELLSPRVCWSRVRLRGTNNGRSSRGKSAMPPQFPLVPLVGKVGMCMHACNER